jgi:hypothetical protein
MTGGLDAYRTHSRWTDPGPFAARLREIPPDPPSVLRALTGLLMHPMLAPLQGVFVPEAALDDRKIRSVEGLLARVAARDGRRFDEPRPSEARVFCVCAGFARLATAVFRTHGVPARCRVGFAAYFSPGHLEDHWVCEYRADETWRLLDAQLDDHTRRENGIAFSPCDVPRDQFVDASTAWRRMRAGELDPAVMGLSPLGLTGEWFVAGDLMLDVAALNKEEMLPWEKWSIGRTLGPGSTVPAEWAARFDEVAALLSGAPDGALAARVYAEREWLRVTPTVLSFSDGAPADVPSHEPGA